VAQVSLQWLVNKSRCLCLDFDFEVRTEKRDAREEGPMRTFGPKTDEVTTKEEFFFAVFTKLKIQVVVFWVLNGGSTVLRNVGILPHHYTASQHSRKFHKSCLQSRTLNGLSHEI
jgi:hypothetical protein